MTPNTLIRVECWWPGAKCESHLSYPFHFPNQRLRHKRCLRCCWGSGSYTELLFGDTGLRLEELTSLPRTAAWTRVDRGKYVCLQELTALTWRQPTATFCLCFFFPVSLDTCEQGRRAVGRRLQLRMPGPSALHQNFLPLLSKVPVVPAGLLCAAPMHLCLSHSPPLGQLLRSGRGELQPQSSFSSCLARPPGPQRPKKHVVFADRKGLALTSIHRFEDAEGRDYEESACPVSNFLRPALPGSPKPTTYTLGFPAPGRDPPGHQVPADSEPVPGAVRGAGGLPAWHLAGARTGF